MEILSTSDFWSKIMETYTPVMESADGSQSFGDPTWACNRDSFNTYKGVSSPMAWRRAALYPTKKFRANYVETYRDVLATTQPAMLLPSMDLIGVYNMVIRKRFRNPDLSAFGLFDVYDTFAVAEMASLVPMGRKVSPDDRNPNISTLQIAFRGPPGEWRVIQDYREKSVLNGLSSAGGLGSFVSLLCTILFGTSLFSVLFRTKPFSAFGLLHSLKHQREELAGACRKKYPKLEAELREFETEEDRGVQALILHTLLDLDMVKEQLTRPQSPVSDVNTVSGTDLEISAEPKTETPLLSGEA
ncbi:hypothetical protein MD484_g5426, partial [Candolleomyces efflorescens]